MNLHAKPVPGRIAWSKQDFERFKRDDDGKNLERTKTGREDIKPMNHKAILDEIGVEGVKRSNPCNKQSLERHRREADGKHPKRLKGLTRNEFERAKREDDGKVMTKEKGRRQEDFDKIKEEIDMEDEFVGRQKKIDFDNGRMLDFKDYHKTLRSTG